MADTKISALTGATTPLAGTEVLPIVQSSTTKQVSVANLTAGRSVTATNFIPSGSSIPTNGVYLPAANAVGIATNSTNAIYVNSSQNVGMGTASPGYRADVSNGDLRVTRNSGDGFVWVGNQTTSYYMSGGTSSNTLYFVANGSNRLQISSAGIITMSAYGAGAATFSAAGVISSVSDENWKRKDGVPSNPIEMLNKLEPGYWYYNDKYKDTYGVDRQLGFYAQNVNAAIGPEAAPEPESYMAPNDEGVDTLQQKPWGYYDRSVLAVVVMALQEALATVKTLETRIQALEAKI